MNHLTQGLRMLAVIIALMLPWSAAQALETFSESGPISVKGVNSFTIKGQVYRLHPNVVFNSRGSSRQQVSELEKGDKIAFIYEDVGGDYYINYIQVLVYEKDEDDE
jgi:hypothetical protein